jgi:hypothetical protein
MATRIDQFSADPVRPTSKNQSNFPWDVWADGSIYRVESGVDYTSQRGLLAALTKRAKKDGKTLRLARFEDAVEFVME